MGTEKRQRQKQGRQARLAQQETTKRRDQRRRRLALSVLLAVAVFAVLVLISQAGTDDAADEAASTTETTAPAGSTTTEAADATPFEYGTGECPPAEKPAEPVREFPAAPQRCISDGVDYAARVTTSEGALTVDLLEGQAPGTVNNFVALARFGYYDGDDFHRIIPGFVVQGGDPVGQPPGTGGPGYEIADELPASVEDYVEGSVAMANAGPDTNGSQFYIYLGPNRLPGPNFSLFGQVTEGLDVVKAIEAKGTPGGTPTAPVTITSVEILEQ
jgi:cyclophilin family peptidyl-prolyl cis-trans isomerase